MVLRIFKMIATSGFLTPLRVHQIRFRPWFRPGPRWGSLQRSPRPPSWFKGSHFLGEGAERGKEAGIRTRKEGEGMPPPFRKFLDLPMQLANQSKAAWRQVRRDGVLLPCAENAESVDELC